MCEKRLGSLFMFYYIVIMLENLISMLLLDR